METKLIELLEKLGYKQVNTYAVPGNKEFTFEGVNIWYNTEYKVFTVNIF